MKKVAAAFVIASLFILGCGPAGASDSVVESSAAALGILVGSSGKSAEEILSRDKRDPEGWVLLARDAYSRGAYHRTLKLCQKALKYQPHYSPAYFWRGRAFEAMGQMDEAKNEYHAATLCNQK